MTILEEISAALQAGRAEDVAALVQEAIDSNIAAQEILDNGLLAGMSIIGTKFKNNEVYVPEVLIAARALNRGTDILKPRLLEEGVKPIGTAVICTVKGDLHDIGKNLVKMMLEGVGFETIDLGVDASAEKIVEAVKAHNPQVVCLSALLTTTMNQLEIVVQALEAAQLRDRVKVMIGGAPVTQAYCDQIGADAYAPDAASAAEIAKAFVA